MKKLSAFVSAALLAVGGAALAQDQPKPTDRPSEKVTPDRPLPKSTADKPDSTMPSQSPAVGRDADHERMGAKADAKVGVTYPARTSEINKHIAFVDLYLEQATTHAKALNALGDAEPGKKDTALIQEGRKGLDLSIDKGLSHLKHVRTFKGDLAMAAPGHDSSSMPSVGSTSGGGDKLAKLDDLERHLKEAKAASKKLASVKLDGLSNSVDDVSTHLVAARSTFKDIAKWTSYTLLEDTDLATVPVSGEDTTPAGEVDRDLGTGTGTGTGSMTPGSGTGTGAMGTGTATDKGTTGTGTSPGATTPDTATTPGDLGKPGDTSAPKTGTPLNDRERNKGNTIPGSSRPEPTKPAPGGGY